MAQRNADAAPPDGAWRPVPSRRGWHSRRRIP